MAVLSALSHAVWAPAVRRSPHRTRATAERSIVRWALHFFDERRSVITCAATSPLTSSTYASVTCPEQAAQPEQTVKRRDAAIRVGWRWSDAMTAAPVNQSESSPREAATGTAGTPSSRTRIGPYLACYPQAETNEQHIDPQDACEDEYEDIEHGVPKG